MTDRETVIEQMRKVLESEGDVEARAVETACAALAARDGARAELAAEKEANRKLARRIVDADDRSLLLEKALGEIVTDTRWAEDMHREDPKALRYALVMTRERARAALSSPGSARGADEAAYSCGHGVRLTEICPKCHPERAAPEPAAGELQELAESIRSSARAARDDATRSAPKLRDMFLGEAAEKEAIADSPGRLIEYWRDQQARAERAAPAEPREPGRVEAALLLSAILEQAQEPGGASGRDILRLVEILLPRPAQPEPAALPREPLVICDANPAPHKEDDRGDCVNPRPALPRQGARCKCGKFEIPPPDPNAHWEGIVCHAVVGCAAFPEVDDAYSKARRAAPTAGAEEPPREAAAPPLCTDYAPAGYTGHWRDWHRGHGCDKDAASPPAQSPLYVIVDTRSMVGNSALFWGPKRGGYTTDLSRAGRYSQREAEDQERQRKTDKACPLALAQELARPAVDGCVLMRRLRAAPLAEEKPDAT